MLLTVIVAQGTDQLPLWPNRAFNVISCVVVWMLALFASYWKSHPQSFTIKDWWRDDQTRFTAGLIATIGLVILKATSTTVDDILKLIGFQVTTASGAAYGFAIATFLLGLKSITKEQNWNGNAKNKTNEWQTSQK
jgi:hypothetical protein